MSTDGPVVKTARDGSGIMPQIYNGNLSLVSMYKGKNEEDDYQMNWCKPMFGRKESDKSLPVKLELGPVSGEYAIERLKALWKACSDLIKEHEKANAPAEKPPV